MEGEGRGGRGGRGGGGGVNEREKELVSGGRKGRIERESFINRRRKRG